MNTGNSLTDSVTGRSAGPEPSMPAAARQLPSQAKPSQAKAAPAKPGQAARPSRRAAHPAARNVQDIQEIIDKLAAVTRRLREPNRR